MEVIAALHDNPCVAVPIVLARLRQKDEEWKAALREWNRVWREVDGKNYYRALDHQAILAKISDKKFFTAKHLVTEIEVARREQIRFAIVNGTEGTAPNPRRYQFAYVMDDESVLIDALRLFLSFLDRIAGSYSEADKDRIEAFLRQFLPLVLGMSAATLDAHLAPLPPLLTPLDGDDSDAEGVTTSDAESSAPVSTGRRPGRKPGTDLRKKALRNAGGPSDRATRRAREGTGASATPAESESGSPAPETLALDDGMNTDDGASDILSNNAQDNEERSVPATAGGLDMEGVETIATALDVDLMAADSDVEMAVAVADVPAEVNQVLEGEAKAFESEQQPGLPMAGTDNSRRFNFFCATPHYCFLRLLQVSLLLVLSPALL